jgi:hypothetical protein
MLSLVNTGEVSKHHQTCFKSGQKRGLLVPALPAIVDGRLLARVSQASTDAGVFAVGTCSP